MGVNLGWLFELAEWGLQMDTRMSIFVRGFSLNFFCIKFGVFGSCIYEVMDEMVLYMLVGLECVLRWGQNAREGDPRPNALAEKLLDQVVFSVSFRMIRSCNGLDHC